MATRKRHEDMTPEQKALLANIEKVPEKDLDPAPDLLPLDEQKPSSAGMGDASEQEVGDDGVKTEFGRDMSESSQDEDIKRLVSVVENCNSLLREIHGVISG